MIVLAIDTCGADGSVAVLRGADVLQTIAHSGDEGYSTWLLPTVESLLRTCGLGLKDIELFAVAPGPGSFTGVRIGLTTVKAWSEVFGRPIAAVSRLEAIAWQGGVGAPYVASFIDAQRGQLFGTLYRPSDGGMELCGAETVSGTEDFLLSVAAQTGTAKVTWISTSPAVLESAPTWQQRAAQGEQVLKAEGVLAPFIGKIGLQKAIKGNVLDALSLDANYVRRPYVEVSWKGTPNAAGK
jgi:tRNA threonylcarbamoyladenosine biosynthesis protein TsaB